MPAISTEAFARFERLSFVPRRPTRAGLGGEHRSRRPSPSTDFVDYRPYQPGDDFRRVDWNVYGRLGSLQVKVTEGRERLDVVFFLDCSGSMALFDKLEFSTQLVASLGYVALSRADRVHVRLLGQPSTGGPWRGRARTGELVKALSAVVPVGAVELSANLEQSLPRDAVQPLVVVVSDLLAEDGVAQAWDALAAVDAVVLQVVAPEELDPAFSGEVEIVDAESGAVLEIGASLETLDAYRARYRTWLEQQQVECERRGMRYVRVQTNRGVPTVVLEDLRRAGVLR